MKPDGMADGLAHNKKRGEYRREPLFFAGCSATAAFTALSSTAPRATVVTFASEPILLASWLGHQRKILPSVHAAFCARQDRPYSDRSG